MRVSAPVAPFDWITLSSTPPPPHAAPVSISLPSAAVFRQLPSVKAPVVKANLLPAAGPWRKAVVQLEG